MIADANPHLRSPQQLTPYRHYRLVLDTIGTKLEKFHCSQGLVKAVYTSLQGKLAKRWQSCNAY
jgi:hypothetical protein